MSREEPVVPLNPATHPLREEALIAWRDKYAKQSLISDAPPSWFKCFTQGYVAGHAALTAQLAALRADVEAHAKKWRDYEQGYVLPCFKWAEDAGIDLRKLVLENPGRNCVDLLVAALRAERDEVARVLVRESLRVGSLQATIDQGIAHRDMITRESDAMRAERDEAVALLKEAREFVFKADEDEDPSAYPALIRIDAIIGRTPS